MLVLLSKSANYVNLTKLGAQWRKPSSAKLLQGAHSDALALETRLSALLCVEQPKIITFQRWMVTCGKRRRKAHDRIVLTRSLTSEIRLLVMVLEHLSHPNLLLVIFIISS